MKKSILFLLFFSPSLLLFADVNNDEQLKSLLDNKDYFRLRTVLENNAGKISKEMFLYYSAFADNAFNRNDESIKAIQTLFDEFSSSVQDSIKSGLLMIQQDNYSKTYRYKQASDVCENLYNNYKQYLDSVELSDLQTTRVIWKALSGTDEQKTNIKGETKITWNRDKVGLMNVPVTFGDSIYNFVFDTGANISTLNESFAKKLGLKIMDVTFNVGGSTGVQNKSALCVVDSFKLGDILLNNVVFLIIPDEQLSFPQINYRINGIIGYPVIEQLKEVRLNKNGIITVPVKASTGKLKNLAMNGLMPIISLATDNDTLSFHFDTGAHTSELFKPYFDKYKNEIVEKGELGTRTRGGAGGSVEAKVYKLKNFNLYINAKKAVFPEISVLIDPTDIDDNAFYGNIGQDLISQFDEMTINFEEMFIDFK